MKMQFTKMSGAGNDFVVFDNRTGFITDPEKLAKKVCDRRFGIGADGVLLLEKSQNAAFEMKYYNADGSNAGMCGNGGRCLAKFAFDIGVVTTESFTFHAFGHIYVAKRLRHNEYQLKMKDPYNAKIHQKIATSAGVLIANYINTGTDHVVLFLEDNNGITPLTDQIIAQLGREIRYHSEYLPLGTNVNFVSLIGASNIKLRTYERGVEAETLACGTGSVASAILGSDRYGISSPVSVEVLSGETLDIAFTKSGSGISDVQLKGSAITTFIGEIDY